MCFVFGHVMRLLFFMLIGSATHVFAQRHCTHDTNNFRCVQYVSNYDGDTITVNIAGVHPLVGNKVNVRVAGIDTPEIRTRKQCEKQIGKAAKQLVANLLSKARRIDLQDVERGKYFRIVANVIVDGRNLKDELLRRGLAYPYDGGKKPKVNWCGGR